MKTLKKVQIQPHLCEYIPEQKDMVQDVIYISVTYKTSSHLCLCGCGNLAVTPFKNPDDWVFIMDRDKLSITPSILNTNCPNRAHYVISKNIANLI